MKTRVGLFFSAFIFSAVFGVAAKAAPSLPIVPVPDRGEGPGALPVDTVPAPDPECVVRVTALQGSAGMAYDLMEGETERRTSNLLKGDWFDAGATISTGEGAILELLLPDGSVVHVGPNSTLKLGVLHCEAEGPFFSFGLMTGSLWSKVAPGTNKDKKQNIETEHAVIAMHGAAFLVETYTLDTVYKRNILDMYPPELRGTFEGLDANATSDISFKGNVTRVAVFEGSVEVTERLSDKSVAVEGGKETIAGVKEMPMSVGPIGGRKGFNAKGEFK